MIKTLAFISFLIVGGYANASSLVANTISPVALQTWQDYKYGLFVHWGPYAVAAGQWEGQAIEKLGEQIQRHADISAHDYDQLAKRFQPHAFNANQLVNLATANGMQYMVFTAKHHDGFAMYHSKNSDFNVVDHGDFGRDIVKEISDAAKQQGLPLGLYYSTPDWHFTRPSPERNPVDGKLSVFAKVSNSQAQFEVDQLTELMTGYGNILELFFDMGEPTPQQSKLFRETVKSIQPNTIINSRIMHYQGDILTLPDNHLPQQPVLDYPWESPSSFHHTWGFKNTIAITDDASQIKRQVKRLSAITSLGGNFLLNVGPDANGQVPEYEIRGIQGIHHWLQTHGEAIFNASAVDLPPPAWGYISQSNRAIYLHIHQWPTNNQLVVENIDGTVKRANTLNERQKVLPVSHNSKQLIIDLNDVHRDPYLTVIKLTTKGKVSLSQPSISAKQQQFVLTDKNAQREHEINAISYRSLLIDRERWWQVNLESAGCYQASIQYAMPYSEKEFKLYTTNHSQQFTLKGKNKSVSSSVELMDGNEVEVKSDATTGDYIQHLPQPICFDKAGSQKITLAMPDKFNDQASQVDFRAQDRRYRSLKLKIKQLTLKAIN